MEHSIKFPLPFGIHLGFVIISVILLILCYIQKKHKYELYMLIGVASTMLVYIADTDPIFYILGLEEMILLAMTIIDMVKVSKENAKIGAALEKDNAEKTADENISEEYTVLADDDTADDKE